VKTLLFVLLTSAVMSFGQTPASGIFIVKKPGKRDPCERELRMLIGGKRICVLEKPIVDVAEIDYVTDILYDPVLKCNHINVGLSSSGVQTLNITVSSISKAEFAIVVNHHVIGTFIIQERMSDNFLRLGTDLNFIDLVIVRDALDEVGN
jgi:hypothetical protein